MSKNIFETSKLALLECIMLPESIKEMLRSMNNLVNDLYADKSKNLWILLHDFIKETFEENTEDKELISCYKCIFNLVRCVIKSAEDIKCVHEYDHLLKTILIFQSFYPTNFNSKFKEEIVKMYYNFWKIVLSSYDESKNSLQLIHLVITQNFHSTLNYLFDAIEVTTKTSDMKILSSLLKDFCEVVVVLSDLIDNNPKVDDPTDNDPKDGLNLIIALKLEKIMELPLFLETETGKLTIANVYATNQQLFLKFHQIVKTNLPKVNKTCAEAYGDIYFTSWFNSSGPMREVIEQQGIFDIISKTIILDRTSSTYDEYHNSLIFLQSVQNHRRVRSFSKVITQLYAPILWGHLESDIDVDRHNATEMLARAYPLEKIGERREVSSRFLIKQQNALLNLLEDDCPVIRIEAIKGICSCMRYFWNTFERSQINKCFRLFSRLIDESVFEVRRALFYGFCQLVEESNSHAYFKAPSFMKKIKETIDDENEKVRRAFIQFLLKIKNIKSQLVNTNKICFTDIVDLNDIASALADEEKQNGLLWVDLIFENFIGNEVPNENTTLVRFYTFYKINPTALRNFMMYSEKNLDFNSACKLIMSLFETIHFGIEKKKKRLKSFVAKQRNANDDSGNNSDSSYSSCSSSASINDENEQINHTNLCCILDCIYSLMVLHCSKFMEKSNNQKMKEIQNSCALSLIELFKFFKEGDAFFSAMRLASLIPESKLIAHVPVSNMALTIVRNFVFDGKNAEEIDMTEINCLISTLCMWKRGSDILQFVNHWFDEAFYTLNHYKTQYPKSSITGKVVRFNTNIEECKPMAGIVIINSMLINEQIQKILLDSDVTKKQIYDLIIYLQRIKTVIEHRISSDNILNNFLTDEVLIELFLLHLRLHIIYHSHDEENLCVDEIINYQTSIFDWVIKNVLIHDFHHKNEITIKFTVKVIEVVNYTVLNMCLLEFANQSYLDSFFTFTASSIYNYLGPRILISVLGSLVRVSEHYIDLKESGDLVNDTLSQFINCVCTAISVVSKSNYDEKSFTAVIGEPPTFRRYLTMLGVEIYKLSATEFEQVFKILIESIINIMANQIRENDEVDLNTKLSKMSFAASQLTMVILSDAWLKKKFTSSAILIFSSDIYKNDCILWLSAVAFVNILSSYNYAKSIDFEPVLRLLYTILLDYETSRPLGDNCTLNNTTFDSSTVVLETSNLSYQTQDLKIKGRNILISTAMKLHINLAA